MLANFIMYARTTVRPETRYWPRLRLDGMRTSEIVDLWQSKFDGPCIVDFTNTTAQVEAYLEANPPVNVGPTLITKVNSMDPELRKRFYTAISERATTLILKDLTVQDLAAMMPYYTVTDQLETLNMDGIDLSMVRFSNSRPRRQVTTSDQSDIECCFIELPTNLKELTLTSCNLSEDLASDWFSHLAATLVHLRLGSHQAEARKHLKKLHNLVSCELVHTPLYEPCPHLLPNLWPRLKSLTMTGIYCPSVLLDKLAKPQILTELHIHIGESKTVALAHLKMGRLDITPRDYKCCSTISSYHNLRKLTLFNFYQPDLMKFTTLGQLTHLTLNYSTLVTAKSLATLVLQLPNLKSLNARLLQNVLTLTELRADLTPLESTLSCYNVSRLHINDNDTIDEIFDANPKSQVVWFDLDADNANMDYESDCDSEFEML